VAPVPALRSASQGRLRRHGVIEHARSLDTLRYDLRTGSYGVQGQQWPSHEPSANLGREA
jgi:hypothetical protein